MFLPSEVVLRPPHKMLRDLSYDESLSSQVGPAGFGTDAPIFDALPYIIGFNALQCSGLTLLSATFLTYLLSPTIRRSTTWVLFAVSWIMSPIGYLLIVTHQVGDPPPRGLCLAQAMFIYATPALNGVSAVSYLFHVYISTNRLRNSQSVDLSLGVSLLLHMSPVCVFVAVLLEVLILDSLDATHLKRAAAGMYCSMTIQTPVQTTGGIVVISMSAVLALEVVIFIAVRRDWAKCMCGHGSSLNVILRVAIFTVCSGVAIALSFSFAGSPSSSETAEIEAQYSVALACMPLVAGLLFSTQRDILSVWMFWRKPSNNLGVPWKSAS